MMPRFRFLLPSAASGLFPALALAAGAPAEPSPWLGLFKVALSLGVIVVAIVLVLNFMRRLMVGGGLGGQNVPLRLRGGIMLGQRERVVVVEVEETWLVIGVTATQMTLLHSMPKGELPPGAAPASIGQQWLEIWRKRQAAAARE